MRTRTGLAGAAAAALFMAQPALAEAVVVKCTIMSGNAGHIVESSHDGWPGPGDSAVYKIGDGKWLLWDAPDQKWYPDFCNQIAGVFSSPLAPRAQVGCNLSDSQFAANAALPPVEYVEVTINRETGAWTTREYYPPNEYNSGTTDYRSTGTCEKTEEPKPPPPPPKKF